MLPEFYLRVASAGRGDHCDRSRYKILKQITNFYHTFPHLFLIGGRKWPSSFDVYHQTVAERLKVPQTL